MLQLHLYAKFATNQVPQWDSIEIYWINCWNKCYGFLEKFIIVENDNKTWHLCVFCKCKMNPRSIRINHLNAIHPHCTHILGGIESNNLVGINFILVMDSFFLKKIQRISGHLELDLSQIFLCAICWNVQNNNFQKLWFIK